MPNSSPATSQGPDGMNCVVQSNLKSILMLPPQKAKYPFFPSNRAPLTAGRDLVSRVVKDRRHLCFEHVIGKRCMQTAAAEKRGMQRKIRIRASILQGFSWRFGEGGIVFPAILIANHDEMPCWSVILRGCLPNLLNQRLTGLKLGCGQLLDISSHANAGTLPKGAGGEKKKWCYAGDCLERSHAFPFLAPACRRVGMWQIFTYIIRLSERKYADAEVTF